VGDWDQIDALADAAHRRFGRVDVLVNNAGVSPLYPSLVEVTESLFDKTLAVNVKGAFRLAAVVGSKMVASGGGSIINISSTGSVRPQPDFLPYAMAKAALNTMTIGLAQAYGPTVRVNAILPGGFLTGVSAAWDPEQNALDVQRPAMKRWGSGGRDRLCRVVLRQRRLHLHHGSALVGRRRHAVAARRSPGVGGPYGSRPSTGGPGR
jgi:NAD(P)-dependent dehydrogenase (short-subunit alcohol dehydrogenase family)